MEIQVLDDPAPEYATIKPFQHCGSLYGLAAAKPGALKPAGEWQKYQILCDGQHVKVTLNGTVVVDANLADYQNDVDPSRRQADRRIHRPAESRHARSTIATFASACCRRSADPRLLAGSALGSRGASTAV